MTLFWRTQGVGFTRTAVRTRARPTAQEEPTPLPAASGGGCAVFNAVNARTAME
jgi:hypothetical protein